MKNRAGIERGISWVHGFRHWIGRPVGRLSAVVAVLLVAAAPAWLMSDHLPYFLLFGDDFPYLASVRGEGTLLRSLFLPHNTHIVPLFRIWTFLLASLAGNLERTQLIVGVGSYVGLLVAMGTVGIVVRRESGRLWPALVAMAVLGVSSVTMPCVTWYSAGQALWAGAAVAATVGFARSWHLKGGALRLALVILCSISAPLFWTGGHVAAPAAAAYLWIERRRGSRRVALALILISAALIGGELVAVKRELTQNSLVWEQHEETYSRPVQAVFHSIQATAEALVLGNLGIDARTSVLQSATILGLIATAWFITARGRKISGLEAAGLVVVAFSYLMVYAFRGNLPFEHLRAVRWYHAIPQVGAVLFASGWFTGSVGRAAGASTSRAALAGVIGCTILLLGLHAPMAADYLLAQSPPLAETERILMATRDLQYRRAVYLAEVRHRRQLAQLVRLDQAEIICRRRGIGAETLRRVFGRVLIPGIPEAQRQSDVVTIMRLPHDRHSLRDEEVRLLLSRWMSPEPESRPPWLFPTDSWPPTPK